MAVHTLGLFLGMAVGGQRPTPQPEPHSCPDSIPIYAWEDGWMLVRAMEREFFRREYMNLFIHDHLRGDRGGDPSRFKRMSIFEDPRVHFSHFALLDQNQDPQAILTLGVNKAKPGDLEEFVPYIQGIEISKNKDARGKILHFFVDYIYGDALGPIGVFGVLDKLRLPSYRTDKALNFASRSQERLRMLEDIRRTVSRQDEESFSEAELSAKEYMEFLVNSSIFQKAHISWRSFNREPFLWSIQINDRRGYAKLVIRDLSGKTLFSMDEMKTAPTKGSPAWKGPRPFWYWEVHDKNYHSTKRGSLLGWGQDLLQVLDDANILTSKSKLIAKIESMIDEGNPVLDMEPWFLLDKLPPIYLEVSEACKVLPDLLENT